MPSVGAYPAYKNGPQSNERGKIMRRVLIYLSELAIVVASVALGRLVSTSYEVIPRAIFPFPEVSIRAEDFSTILAFFVIIHAVIFLVSGRFAGAGVFTDVKRTAIEIYALVAGFALSSVSLFMFTEVPFDPELMASSAILAFVAFLLVFAAISARGNASEAGRSFLALIRALFRQAIRPAGILAILLAILPMAMAKMYVTDRDFANLVTRARIFFSAPAASGYALVNAFPGLSFRQPIIVKYSPADDSAAYVLERHGRLIRLMPNDAAKEVVLDISGRVGPVDVENGALGFSHHPDYGRPAATAEGYVYIYFTSVTEGRQINYLSRFDLSLPSADERLASEIILIALERSPDGFHNGGSVDFGPDGFLYLAIGEASDRASYQRIDNNLVGGIFRLDVDQSGADISHPIPRQPTNAKTNNYYIPNDNPFVDVPGALEEFWALGLRNPFRFSFDPETGRVWVGDVGSARFEEVNIVEAGGNYQYPYIEGREGTGSPKPAEIIGVDTGPIYFYEHTAFDRAVIGGVVYRSAEYADLDGKYVFADNYSGKILALEAIDKVQLEAELLTVADQVAQQGVSSVVMAPSGRILVTTLGRSQAETGQVLALVRVEGMSSEELAGAGSITSAPPVTPAEARESYNSYCGRCHGLTGRGDGPDAAELDVPLPDFTDHDFWHMRSDEDLAAVIRLGGEAAGLSPMMPPWDSILSEAEVTAILHHMRELEGG